MNWIWWIIVGFFAGALAKRIAPGDHYEPKGCVMTILLGIAGSVLVGFLMQNFLHMTGSGGIIASICGATIGSVIILYLCRAIWK